MPCTMYYSYHLSAPTIYTLGCKGSAAATVLNPLPIVEAEPDPSVGLLHWTVTIPRFRVAGHSPGREHNALRAFDLRALCIRFRLRSFVNLASALTEMRQLNCIDTAHSTLVTGISGFGILIPVPKPVWIALNAHTCVSAIYSNIKLGGDLARSCVSCYGE
jgi:hypothetical protein